MFYKICNDVFFLSLKILIKSFKFIKLCFHQPRRTFKNNLEQYHYDLSKVPEAMLQLRSQQMSKEDLVVIWNLIRG